MFTGEVGEGRPAVDNQFLRPASDRKAEAQIAADAVFTRDFVQPEQLFGKHIKGLQRHIADSPDRSPAALQL